jgi:hypothetical protein
MATRGRNRYVFSTCRAADDLSVGCGRSGPDIVVSFQVTVPGNVAFTFTTPRGVEVYVGYDLVGGMQCHDTVSGGRVCMGDSASNVRTTRLFLTPGIYHLYVMTNVESTVVIDAELP